MSLLEVENLWVRFPSRQGILMRYGACPLR